jgi:8-oxo-dGTP diphosphatase
VNLRVAVRAIVVDDADRVALVRFDFPDRTVWATPGGGIEHHESDEAALRRELQEELGLELPGRPCAHVWQRTHVFPMARWDGQTERYYLVRVPPFELRPALAQEELRREGIGAVRWWSLEEIRAATDTVFAPRRLAHFLGLLLRDGPPAEALDVGV